ncbi:MAG TPA: sugar transferase [Thermoleophilia bacterium]|nr:sugar transferase [Thermoleophilia bacterium]
MPELRMEDEPLLFRADVADAGYMSDGALRSADTYGELVGQAAAFEHTLTKRPAKLRIAATVGADAIGILIASSLAGWVTGSLAGVPVAERLVSPFSETMGGAFLLVALVPYWLAALWAFGLYRAPGRSIGGADLTETLGGLTALTSASWLLLILLVLIQGSQAPIGVLIVFWLIAIAVVPICRTIGRHTVWSTTALRERVLIIGAGEVGHMIAEKISKHREYRITLVGFLDDGEPRRNGMGGPPVPMVGAFHDLKRVVLEQRVDRVIVAFSQARHDDFLRIVRTCADSAVRVNIVPRLFEVVSSRALVDDVEGIPLLDVGHVELSRFNVFAKRAFDLLVGGIIFLCFLPVLAVMAIVIKLESRGPVFFRQERMGRGGKPFMILKFRSMRRGADELREELTDQNEYSGPMFKMRSDPRVTRIGEFIRRWSIDELPQIINVMKGDMSLVGPRPLWVEEARQVNGWTQKRLDITPGITGLWQVLGRSDIPFDEMVKLDYMYVTGWSLSWDIKLLLQTVPAVLAKRGAY